TSCNPLYSEPQIIYPMNDDEQGRCNFVQSPSRRNRRLSDTSLLNYTESPSRHNRRQSDTSLHNYTESPSHNSPNYRSNCNVMGDSYNELSSTHSHNKSTFRDTEIQNEISINQANNLFEHPRNNVTNFNKEVQSENCVMDSDSLTDEVTDKRDSREIVGDDIAESMHKRPRIDVNDDMENLFA